MKFRLPFTPGGNVVRLPVVSQLREADVLPESKLIEEIDRPQRALQVPIMARVARYDCFVIRSFGSSEQVPEKLFIHGRVYYLSSARLERQPEWQPHEFMVSCKFSLERKPKNATRR